MSALAKVLEEVIVRFAGGPFEIEARAAREHFLEATGKVFDDDPLFEERIGAFLEWYALERPLDGGTLRPIDRYLKEGTPGEKERDAAQALASSHWSLFLLEEVQPGRTMLADLLGGGRFLVHERRTMAGLEAGDIFEARLISDGGKTIFGRSFGFHPRDAADAIRTFITQAAEHGDSRQEILFRLAERKLRSTRYRATKIDRVYLYEPQS